VLDAKGLTQGELEARAHLSENRISKWRNTNQKTHPRWEEVVSLARVLDVSLDWLASGAPDELPPGPTKEEELLSLAIEKMGAKAALDKILSPSLPSGYAVPTDSVDPKPNTPDAPRDRLGAPVRGRR
jgi:transcriptional regulator with XRE-family HTH domain